MRPEYAKSWDDAECMARTAWCEARSEGLAGLAAVCSVIQNRSHHPGWWGHDVRSVCFAPWQFSCWNEYGGQVKRALRIKPDDPEYLDARMLSEDCIAGRLWDRTRGATHYHADYVNPDWAEDARITARIGRHIFYADVP